MIFLSHLFSFLFYFLVWNLEAVEGKLLSDHLILCFLFLFFLKLQDADFTTPLVIPTLGLELRTSVYVQVQAANLTNQ